MDEDEEDGEVGSGRGAGSWGDETVVDLRLLPRFSCERLRGKRARKVGVLVVGVVTFVDEDMMFISGDDETWKGFLVLEFLA